MLALVYLQNIIPDIEQVNENFMPEQKLSNAKYRLDNVICQGLSFDTQCIQITYGLDKSAWLKRNDKDDYEAEVI